MKPYLVLNMWVRETEWYYDYFNDPVCCVLICFHTGPLNYIMDQFRALLHCLEA